MSEIPPVQAIDGYNRQKGSKVSYGERKKTVPSPIDSKIHDLILSQIQQASPCTLFVSVTSYAILSTLVAAQFLPRPKNFPHKIKREKD